MNFPFPQPPSSLLDHSHEYLFSLIAGRLTEVSVLVPLESRIVKDEDHL